MKTGIELITEERLEQIEKHGRSISEDVMNNSEFQLLQAANALTYFEFSSEVATNAYRPYGWNLEIWRRMCNKKYKERLIIAGALIAAEIDRLQNSPPNPQEKP